MHRLGHDPELPVLVPADGLPAADLIGEGAHHSVPDHHVGGLDAANLGELVLAGGLAVADPALVQGFADVFLGDAGAGIVPPVGLDRKPRLVGVNALQHDGVQGVAEVQGLAPRLHAIRVELRGPPPAFALLIELHEVG